MRLSEAIRLGSMLRPQTRGSYGADGGSCAIGAAAEAAGMNEYPLFHELEARWPVLTEFVACPVTADTSGDVGTVILWLNDSHGWTREAIADWVETLEPRDAVSPASELSPVLAATRIDP